MFHKSHVWLADVQGLERQPFSWRRRRMHTGQTALSLLVCLQYLCSCGSLSRDFQAIDSIHQVGVYCLALVPANTLPKTPLGGIHLSETKQLFLEGSLHPCNVLMCPHTCVTNLPKPRQKQPGRAHGLEGGAEPERLSGSRCRGVPFLVCARPGRDPARPRVRSRGPAGTARCAGGRAGGGLWEGAPAFPEEVPTVGLAGERARSLPCLCARYSYTGPPRLIQGSEPQRCGKRLGACYCVTVVRVTVCPHLVVWGSVITRCLTLSSEQLMDRAPRRRTRLSVRGTRWQVCGRWSLHAGGAPRASGGTRGGWARVAAVFWNHGGSSRRGGHHFHVSYTGTPSHGARAAGTLLSPLHKRRGQGWTRQRCSAMSGVATGLSSRSWQRRLGRCGVQPTWEHRDRGPHPDVGLEAGADGPVWLT